MDFSLLFRRGLLVMLAPLMMGLAHGFGTEAATEQAMRAVLLFNFIKFTEWPLTDSPQMQVCISTGDPELMSAMEVLGERSVRSKSLIVTAYRRQSGCDVIYVDSRQRWDGVVEKHASQALAIGGYAGFVTDGGMIEVTVQDGRARFDIGLRGARRAGLRFYPQLLKLARQVVE